MCVLQLVYLSVCQLSCQLCGGECLRAVPLLFCGNQAGSDTHTDIGIRESREPGMPSLTLKCDLFVCQLLQLECLTRAASISAVTNTFPRNMKIFHFFFWYALLSEVGYHQNSVRNYTHIKWVLNHDAQFFLYLIWLPSIIFWIIGCLILYRNLLTM